MTVITTDSTLRTRSVRPVRYGVVHVEKDKRASVLSRILKIVLVSSIMAGFAFSLWFAYQTATTHPYFEIQSVTMTGNDRLSGDRLLRILNPLLSGNIFTCDIKSATDFLEANPWVESVSIRRQLPSDLLVEISERIPSAVVEADDGRRYLVDKKGYVLEETPSAPEGLVITGVLRGNDGLRPGARLDDASLDMAFALSRLFAKDTAFKDPVVRVDLGDPDRITAVTGKNGVEVSFGTDRKEWDEKFLEYLVVRKILEDRDSPFGSIDLSFKGQAVVSPERRFLDEAITTEKEG